MQKPGPNESPLYKGTFDCAKKTIAKEGFVGLYKGIFIFSTCFLYFINFFALTTLILFIIKT